jgi:alpha-1,3-rhamnosyl/mannosyltransferase
MKKIYIEGLGLVEGHFSGVGQYILGVLQGMDKLIDNAQYSDEKIPEVQVIIPYNTVHIFKKFGFKHITYKRFPISFRLMSFLWYRGKLPPIDLFMGSGFYIFTRFVGMPLLYSKSATVIYDISFELHREYSDERNAKFLSKRIKDTIDKATRIITISNSAKKEIVSFYKLDSANVIVANPAADRNIFYRRSDTEINQVKQKYNIEGNYILALSNLEPRKNLSSLVKAYCDLPASTRDDLSLLLVGVSGWKTEKLYDEIVKRVEEGYKIIRPSKYVADADKPALISGAKMLVYPSHYEGFGMPPIEALACGVPVIAANNSSLPEAVGKAGKLIDLNIKNSIKDAIEECIDEYDRILKNTISKGPEHCLKFSWEKTARKIIDLAETK